MQVQTTPQGVVAGSIPLFAGHPSQDLLPINEIREIMDAVWSRADVTRLFNYGDEQGNAQLIDFLVERLHSSESLTITRDNLMIIGGSTWGVDMITHHLTAPGDVILVDAPSYRDALHIFRDQQLDMLAIAIDEDGIIVEEMERQLRALAATGRAPKFYYVVPNFQNPTGISMSSDRRAAVIELGRRYGFVIVEDDVYRDIRFVDALPASFFAMAEGQNVLRLGTFSKTLAPGMRIGWLLGSADTIRRFVGSGKLRMGGGANPFSAAVVADYCAGGAWDAHVTWLREQYQLRCACALSALRDFMPPGTAWTQPDGGYFIWLRLPENVDVDDLERLAKEQDVYFASGKGFYVDPQAGRRHLRLSFSFVSLVDMQKGIFVLCQLIEDLAAN